MEIKKSRNLKKGNKNVCEKRWTWEGRGGNPSKNCVKDRKSLDSYCEWRYLGRPSTNAITSLYYRIVRDYEKIQTR